MRPVLQRITIPALLFLLAALLGCDQTAIPIGFTGSLTGSYSDLGVQGRNGASLAIEEINAQGGIAGHPLRLVVRDDANDPETAKAVDRELIEHGVVAIIGHMTSSQSVAALPVINEAGVVLLSPTTSTPRLSGKDDYFFRIQTSTAQAARALGRYARTRLDLQRINVIEDTSNAAYTAPFLSNFQDTFYRSGQGVGQQCRFHSEMEQDWPLLAECLLQTPSDGILLLTSARDAASLLPILRHNAPQRVILSSGWATTRSLLTLGGASANQVYAAERNFPAERSPAYLNFVDSYRQRFGSSPSFAAVNGYDAVRVLARALTKTGGQRDGLRRALANIEKFPSLFGPLGFDAFGDALAPTHIFQVQSGSYVLLETVDSP